MTTLRILPKQAAPNAWARSGPRGEVSPSVQTSSDAIPGVAPRSGAARSGKRGFGRRAWVFAQRALLAVALVFLLVLAILPRLGLYKPVTVLSASMRPTFSPGDMVFVVSEPLTSVRVGQVISYRVPVGVHQIETHRVVKILHGGSNPVVQTQGDANNWPDPWTAKLEGSTAWRQVAVVPRLGYLVNALRAPIVRLAAVLIAPAMLLILFLADIWGGGDRDRTRESSLTAGGASTVGTSAGGARVAGQEG